MISSTKILTLISILCCLNWTISDAQVIIQSNTETINKDINKSDAISKPRFSGEPIKNTEIPLPQVKDTIPKPKGEYTLSKDTLENDITYKAQDSIVFDVTNGKLYLYNSSSIEYGEMKLDGHNISMDWNSKELLAQKGVDSLGKDIGMPLFKQGEDFFEANTISYNFETKQGVISEVETKHGEGFLYSEKIRRNNKNELFGLNSYYTTCDAHEPHFKIHTKKVKVIPDKIIASGPANLEIENIKTPLWIPFAIFPIKKGRRSGVIMPTYGDSYDRGFFLRNGGYYFAINDKIDLQLKGDIYSRGSYGIVSLVNYAKRYKYNGNFNINYANNRFGDPSDIVNFSRTREVFVRWFHTQDAKAKPGTNFSASVNAGTSTYYRNNSYVAQDYLNNTFTSSISYSKRWQGKPFQLSVAARHSQNTLYRIINVTLPEVSFTVDRREPFKKKESIKPPNIIEKIGFTYQLNTRNEYSRVDSLFFKKDAFRKFRNGLQHSIPINTSTKIFKYFTLSAGLNYSENWHFQTINKSWGLLSDTSSTEGIVIDTVYKFQTNRFFNSNVSLATRLYGMLQFKKGKLRALRHVMTPSIGYSYFPNFNYNLNSRYLLPYRKNLAGEVGVYSIYESSMFGGPPIGRSNTINFGLDNNLEAKVFTKNDSTSSFKKIKILESFSLRSSYNFAADTFQLSNINMFAHTTILNKVNIIFNSSFDPYIRNYLNVRKNIFEWNQNKRLARFVSGSITMSASLRAPTNKQNSSQNQNNLFNANYDPDELLYYQMNNYQMIDFNLPWNISFYYTLNASKNLNTVIHREELKFNQIINFNGDISLTPKWKLAFNSGYDFSQKEITFTSLDVYRDLHCWEMRFSLIPFGPRQSFNFTVNVKAAILQDLKITRRRDWWDLR